MSLTSTLAATAALAVGSVGAVTAYQIVAPEPVEQSGDQAAAAAVQQPAQRGFAPCRPPAKLERGKCVTHVTRTVAVPAAPEAAPVQPAAAGTDLRARAEDSGDELEGHVEDCEPDEDDETRSHTTCHGDPEEAAEEAEEAAEEAEERAEEHAED